MYLISSGIAIGRMILGDLSPELLLFYLQNEMTTLDINELNSDRCSQKQLIQSWAHTVDIL